MAIGCIDCIFWEKTILNLEKLSKKKNLPMQFYRYGYLEYLEKLTSKYYYLWIN